MFIMIFALEYTGDPVYEFIQDTTLPMVRQH